MLRASHLTCTGLGVGPSGWSVFAMVYQVPGAFRRGRLRKIDNAIGWICPTISFCSLSTPIFVIFIVVFPQPNSWRETFGQIIKALRRSDWSGAILSSSQFASQSHDCKPLACPALLRRPKTPNGSGEQFRLFSATPETCHVYRCYIAW